MDKKSKKYVELCKYIRRNYFSDKPFKLEDRLDSKRKLEKAFGNSRYIDLFFSYDDIMKSFVSSEDIFTASNNLHILPLKIHHHETNTVLDLVSVGIKWFNVYLKEFLYSGGDKITMGSNIEFYYITPGLYSNQLIKISNDVRSLILDARNVYSDKDCTVYELDKRTINAYTNMDTKYISEDIISSIKRSMSDIGVDITDDDLCEQYIPSMIENLIYLHTIIATVNLSSEKKIALMIPED